MSAVEELLSQKQSEYKDAWKLSGEIFEHPELKAKFVAFLSGPWCVYVFNWIIIMNKLFRILATPNHLDSWKDIAGYAQLVVNDLESERSKDGKVH